MHKGEMIVYNLYYIMISLDTALSFFLMVFVEVNVMMISYGVDLLGTHLTHFSFKLPSTVNHINKWHDIMNTNCSRKNNLVMSNEAVCFSYFSICSVVLFKTKLFRVSVW